MEIIGSFEDTGFRASYQEIHAYLYMYLQSLCRIHVCLFLSALWRVCRCAHVPTLYIYWPCSLFMLRVEIPFSPSLHCLPLSQ